MTHARVPMLYRIVQVAHCHNYHAGHPRGHSSPSDTIGHTKLTQTTAAYVAAPAEIFFDIVGATSTFGSDGIY